MYDRRAQYVENHDGDTAKLILDQGFYDTKLIHLRFANVWAPETDEPGGHEVQKYVQDWFNTNVDVKKKWNFIVVTYQVAGHDEMSFNRYIGDVLTLDGKNTLASMVMKFIADKGYSGGTGAPTPQGPKPND